MSRLPHRPPLADLGVNDQRVPAYTGVEAARWRLQLCGQPQLVSTDGERWVLERRDAAMLALLAVDGPTPRHRIMALLWPDNTPDDVRGRLRQRIYMLNRRLGLPVVEGKLTLALNPALQWPGLDLEAAGELLGDEDPADLVEFARWLLSLRLRLHGLRRERLIEEASELERQGRLAEAICTAERLLAFEPLQEHAHRRLMRLHYLRGDRAAALLTFDRCEQTLRDELSAQPSAETMALLAQIERAETPALDASPRPVPASVLRPPRLIGRADEWLRLQAAWSVSHTIIVIGEAGMGKTRLLGDIVAAQTAGRAGVALQVSARPGDERVPYALLARLLRGLLPMRTAPLAPGVEAELAALLPELPQPAHADGGTHSQARLVGAVEVTLRQAVDDGLEAVVLDDLHFADAASLELALHLIGTVGPRWLTAFRGTEIGAAAQALVGSLTDTGRTATVVLQAFGVAQVTELIDTLDINVPDIPGLAVALLQRTGGNPLFLLETLKTMVQQRGASSAADGLAALAGLPPGGNLGRLIEHRIARLSRDAIGLARCAAIAGPDFSAALASQVMQRPVVALTDGWNELEAAHVIGQDGFAHDLIGDAVRGSMPEPIAQHLHGEVAAWLTEHGGEAARVAQHWQQADRPERAGPAWLDAAERCATQGRRAEQAHMLQCAACAFEHAGNPRGRCNALLSRAEVVGQHADLQSGLAALADAASAVADDADRVCLAVTELSVRGFHGQDDHVLALGPDVLDRANRQGLRDQALRTVLALGGTLCRHARAAEAVDLLTEWGPWVEAQGSTEQRQEYWNGLALALDYGSRMREAMQAWETSRHWAQRGGSDLLCQVVGNMAYTSAKMGQVVYAASLGELALDLAQRSSDGFDHQVLEQKLALGHHLRNLGHYQEAVALLETAATGFRQGERRLKARTADCFLAVAWVQLGQPARALLLTASPAEPQVPRMEAMRLAFRALALQASPQEALATIRQALATLDEPDNLWFRTHSLIATAILPTEEAEPMALDLASWAVARERFGLALAAHARAARCALASGAAERALPHLGNAIGLAQTHQPDVYYLPELWWVAAQVYAALGLGAERRQALDAGAQWVRDVGSRHVPSAMQDSFLRRNPINADLLSWARVPGGRC